MNTTGYCPVYLTISGIKRLVSVHLVDGLYVEAKTVVDPEVVSLPTDEQLPITADKLTGWFAMSQGLNSKMKFGKIGGEATEGVIDFSGPYIVRGGSDGSDSVSIDIVVA